MGGAVFPPCCLTWDQTMVEVMKIMVTSFQGPHACTGTFSAPDLQQATASPRLLQGLLDTHGQVWVSLLWAHCSFFLGPGSQALFVLSKHLFPQFCVGSGSSKVGKCWPPPRGLTPHPGLWHPKPLHWQGSSLPLRASLVSQLVKSLPTMQETRVWFLGQEDSLEKEMTTHSSILAWRIPWTEEPDGLQSMRSQESITTKHTQHNTVLYQ